MNKAIIIGLLVLLVAGVVSVKYFGGEKEATSTSVKKASGVMVKDGVISVDVIGKVSMVDLKISVKGGKTGVFESNKDVFNSELLNRIEEDASLHVVLGVLKPTAELPAGEVIVGKLIDTDDGQIEVSGKVTVASEGAADPMEIDVNSGGISSQ